MNFLRFLIILRKSNFKLWYIVKGIFHLYFILNDIEKISIKFDAHKEFKEWLKAKERNSSNYPLNLLFVLPNKISNQVGLNYKTILINIFENNRKFKR